MKTIKPVETKPINPPQTTEEKLEVLRLKINEIIEVLNEKTKI